MTAEHRKRLLVAAAVTYLTLAAAVTPSCVAEGLAAGLGLYALSAIAPTAVLLIVAVIWRGNDRDRARTHAPDAP